VRDEEVFVIGADGRGERRLTRHAFAQRPLRWSRDGATIAFVGGEPTLELVSARGGRVRRLMRVFPQYGETPFDFAWRGARTPRVHGVTADAPRHSVHAVRDHAAAGRRTADTSSSRAPSTPPHAGATRSCTTSTAVASRT